MFELNWGQMNIWVREANDHPAFVSDFNKETIDLQLGVKWEEHCIECAVPDCYSSCVLYRQRNDGKCARFVYGIVPNSKFAGRESFGADIKFRKWAKLEVDLHLAFPLKCGEEEKIARYYEKKYPVRRRYRNQTLRKYFREKIDLDYFLLEFYSPSTDPFNFIIEYFVHDLEGTRRSLYRNSVKVSHGKNSFSIPFADLQINELRGYFYMYPENADIERRLIFTWADFVKLQRDSETTKIKCVAWDLDNTLWVGTIADGDTVQLNANAAALIAELDRRGILQTIVSKNDFDLPWKKLQSLGLDRYFLAPRINWNRKSVNLQEIAKDLNLGLDSFAMIDDSPFERGEVTENLPSVRVYSNTEIDKLASYEEFIHHITSTSIQRRQLYQTDFKRKQQQKTFAGSYDDFLASCKMKMSVFIPADPLDVSRCHEIIQRSNQLNFSLKRYSEQQLNSLLTDPNKLCFAISCKDKFGDYGIVGFCSVSVQHKTAHLADFVLSCRVAQKKIEQTFFKGLVSFLNTKGHLGLDFTLRVTKKNTQMLKVLQELDLDFYHSGDAYISRMEAKHFKNQKEIIETEWF